METQMTMDQINEGRRPAEIRVCVIDDEEDIVRMVRRTLDMKGYNTMGITNVIGSSNKLRNFKPHIIVLDIGLPCINGEDLLAIFHQNLKFFPKVILFSGLPEEDLERLAQQMDADDFQVKADGVFRLVGKVNLLALQLQKSGMAF